MRESAEMGNGIEAHRQLLRLARMQGALDVEIGRWLVVARDARVHIELGYGTFLEYVERVLGYRPRTALDRLRVAEELEELPEIRAALEHGAMTYSAAREITRVAEPGTETEWLVAVVGKTMREVEQLTAGREKGDRPSDPRSLRSCRECYGWSWRPRCTRCSCKRGGSSRTRLAQGWMTAR